MNKLEQMQVGDVCNFEYLQPHSGDTTRHLAKVVSVRKLTQQEINRIDAASRYRLGDSEFHRTETMVTCQLPNGQYRNFYAERTASCKKLPFGRLLFALGMARLLCD